MALEFPKVRNVTNVIALARLCPAPACLISKNGILTACERHLHQIRQKPMQLHSGVPLLQLRKRHLIARIAVNLVRAQKYESLNPIRRDDEHSAKAISSLPLGMN